MLLYLGSSTFMHMEATLRLGFILPWANCYEPLHPLTTSSYIFFGAPSCLQMHQHNMFLIHQKGTTTQENTFKHPTCPRLAEESRRQSSIFQKSVTGDCWNIFSEMMILLMKIVLTMIWTSLF
jgi:hypothetical protein